MKLMDKFLKDMDQENRSSAAKKKGIKLNFLLHYV